MAIKTSISGQPELDGAFSNGDVIVLIVKCDVKEEPHAVNLERGQEMKMKLRCLGALRPKTKKEENELLERIAREAISVDDGQMTIDD